MQQQRWYREFWVWFVIALPLAAVIGGFVTLWIALDGADRELGGSYRQVGMVVYEAPLRDTSAGKRGAGD